MTLIRWRPIRQWDPFADFFGIGDELDKFHDLALRAPPTHRHTQELFVPAIDMYEKGNDTVIKADLPGIDKKDVEITAHDHTLMIKGSRKHEQDVKDENFSFVERSWGSFRRTIKLPSEIDESKIKATFKDGVLEVIIPHAKETKPKQITIDVK